MEGGAVTGMDWSTIQTALSTAYTALATQFASGASTVLPIALPLMGVPMLVRYVRRIFSTASSSGCLDLVRCHA